jgi:3-dehydroquinate synthase
LIGAFHQPRLVLADLGVLDSLPRRELLAGYAEVVKYGLINDAEFFTWCEDNGAALIDGDQDARRHAVHQSCAAKSAIVGADERETGVRALLNLGHTFGHALEAEAGYDGRLLHGEAVAIGCVMAFEVSARMGLCDATDAERIHRHFETVGLPTNLAEVAGPAWTSERLIGHMTKDKKVDAGAINFVLARGIGEAFVTADVDMDAVAAVLTEACC